MGLGDLPDELRGGPTASGMPGGSLEDMERQHIIATLRSVGGHRAKAATVLGTVGSGADPDAIRAQYERQGHPYYSTARLWDDGVIEPAQTRTVLGLALDVVTRTPLPAIRRGVLRM